MCQNRVEQGLGISDVKQSNDVMGKARFEITGLGSQLWNNDDVEKDVDFKADALSGRIRCWYNPFSG